MLRPLSQTDVLTADVHHQFRIRHLAARPRGPKFKAQLPSNIQTAGVIAAKDLTPSLGRSRDIVKGIDATAHAVAGFKGDRFEPLLLQQHRRIQAGQPGAHHDHVGTFDAARPG